MNIDWFKALRASQTHLLLFSTGLALTWFIILLPSRPIVWFSGGTISCMTAISWFLKFQHRKVLPSTVNLLDQQVFLSQLTLQEHTCSFRAKPIWLKVHQQSNKIQVFASQIAQQEATLIPDLLESLHTVLELSDQVRETLKVLDQIQMPVYQNLAEQRLKHSCDRLKTTHEQLQHLYEHTVLSKVSQNIGISQLPERLQLLIDTNKAALQASNSLHNKKD